jgi:opacity protein-like surface antigen
MFNPIRLACAIAALVLSSAAAADTALIPVQLGFDELPDSTGGSHVPAGYAGFTWSDQWFQMSPSVGDTASNFLATSTSGGTLVRRADGCKFYFDGADFWSRRGLDANGDFFFVLYGELGQTLYNGNDDGSAGRMRFTGKSQTLLANYTGAIHGMAWGFDNDDYDHLAMDNFRFRVEAVSTVPEPKLALLAGLGSVVLLGARRLRG